MHTDYPILNNPSRIIPRVSVLAQNFRIKFAGEFTQKKTCHKQVNFFYLAFSAIHEPPKPPTLPSNLIVEPLRLALVTSFSKSTIVLVLVMVFA